MERIAREISGGLSKKTFCQGHWELWKVSTILSNVWTKFLESYFQVNFQFSKISQEHFFNSTKFSQSNKQNIIKERMSETDFSKEVPQWMPLKPWHKKSTFPTSPTILFANIFKLISISNAPKLLITSPKMELLDGLFDMSPDWNKKNIIIINKFQTSFLSSILTEYAELIKIENLLPNIKKLAL